MSKKISPGLKTTCRDTKDAQRKERIFRYKYEKMKSVAKREKKAKKRALAQLAQYQGVVQGMQLSGGAGFMQSSLINPTRRVQAVQPTMFFNGMMPAAANIPIIEEDDSAETIIVPEDII